MDAAAKAYLKLALKTASIDESKEAGDSTDEHQRREFDLERTAIEGDDDALDTDGDPLGGPPDDDLADDDSLDDLRGQGAGASDEEPGDVENARTLRLQRRMAVRLDRIRTLLGGLQLPPVAHTNTLRSVDELVALTKGDTDMDTLIAIEGGVLDTPSWVRARNAIQRRHFNARQRCYKAIKTVELTAQEASDLRVVIDRYLTR